MKTIIISNRLPVKIKKENGALVILPSAGGLATGLSSVYNEPNNIWIGWPGYIPEDESERNYIIDTLEKLHLCPVFLTEDEVEGYYEGFSNEVLWPIFHYHPSYASFDENKFNVYQSVNKKFLHTLEQIEITSKDKIWVHDYQLMLLPQLIKQKFSACAVGYFQHIPFPPDEMFRMIPWRDQLLKGLLGADLIAFHSSSDAEHFIKACTQILHIPHSHNILIYKGKKSRVEILPMGIDFQKFHLLSKDKEVRQLSSEITVAYNNRKIILCIDRLDYSKGILERLNGYELLLKTNSQYLQEVVLYMLIVPSRDSVQKYQELLHEVNSTVGRINAMYGTNDWKPIAYFYKAVEIKELSALYVAADICMVTSLRDGMNLVCKEFIASKVYTSGVLILSEMAGAGRELIGPLLVNPYAINDIKDALLYALEMPKEEQENRMQQSIAIVKQNDIHYWVQTFLRMLTEAQQLQQHAQAVLLTPMINKLLLDQYINARKSLFLLDYDGTLTAFKDNIDEAQPTEQLYQLLDMLQNIPSNQVVIISGRSHENLEKWFGHKSYYLIGEHGAWQKTPTSSWLKAPNINYKWKETIRKEILKLVNLFPGSYIEEKTFALVWHFRTAQEDINTQEIEKLTTPLLDIISEFDLELLYGNKIIEIRNNSINKGIAAHQMVQLYQPDCIIAVGDDTTDEDMFAVLPTEAITVKVGKNPTYAKFRILCQEEVSQFLQLFVMKHIHHSNINKLSEFLYN